MSEQYQTDDLRIIQIKELQSPEKLHADYPITPEASDTVYHARKEIQDVLHGEDDRLLVVVGPCSIHDPDAAREYAQRLKPLRDELGEDLVIVMRVYFEKPRTTVGWKGLINDPCLDDTFHINDGLHLARKLLLDLNHTGVPAATEYLDLITPQYVADLIAWGAIGARTTESQVHRELASGLSCPVGFKNSTDGKMRVAIDAINSASRPHHFLSTTKAGHSAIFSTAGNRDCHIILRGGHGKPNYEAEHVDEACAELEAAGLDPVVMIDFSHANSLKQYKRQLDVAENVSGQINAGDKRIIGVMIESHLVEGRQDCADGQELVYGQSITDACISWEDTVPVLEKLAAAVRERRAKH